MRQVRLPGGEAIPALGQGTWHMGERRDARAAEVSALRRGIELGMTLLDTAEMYGEGGAEEVVGEAVAGRRDDIFIVSKVYPHNASRAGVKAACARSLKRLRTDRIDLYLLHWRGGTPLAETVAAFEKLRDAGQIRYWGVSNFDVDDMAELAGAELAGAELAGAELAGAACATNQVLYNPGARGIEFDLLAWCERRGMPVMAYSPVGQGGVLLRSRALAAIAERHDCTPAQVAIAWSLRLPGMISIPKAAGIAHVEANAGAANLTLTAADLADIDAEFPPPKRRMPLAML